MVGDDVDFACGFEHSFFSFYNEGVGIVKTFRGNAGYADEGFLGAYGFEHVFGVEAEVDACAGVEGAAGADELDVCEVGKEVGDGEGICNDLHALVLEVEGDLIGGCAAVDYDGVTFFDELGGAFADRGFFGGHDGLAVEEGGGAVSFANEHRSAVGALDQTFLFEFVQITSGGGNTDV